MDSVSFVLILALGALLCLSLIVGMFVSIRFSLLVILIAVTFVDAIRKIVGGILLLAITDISILILFISFYTPYLLGQRRRLAVVSEMEPLLKLSLMLWVAIVVLQVFNPKTQNWIVTLAGLRSYLLGIPMIGVGWYVAKKWQSRDYWCASNVILFLITVTVSLGVLVFVQQVFGFQIPWTNILMPMEHRIHSFGFANVELVSSVFASSKRWARYLIFLYIIAQGYLIALKRKSASQYLFWVVLLGLFVSGSREGLILFLFFHWIHYLVTMPRKLVAYTVALGMLTFLILQLYPSDYPEAGEEGFLLRLRFFLSTPDDWIFRAGYMFGAPAAILAKESAGWDLLTGTGVGSYGQEIRLFSEPPEPPHWIPQWARDAGLMKIIAELGLVGFFTFITLQMAILSYAKLLRKARYDSFFVTAFSSAVIWLILFLKSHAIISDQMVNILYWFNIGVLVHRGALAKRVSIEPKNNRIVYAGIERRKVA